MAARPGAPERHGQLGESLGRRAAHSHASAWDGVRGLGCGCFLPLGRVRSGFWPLEEQRGSKQGRRCRSSAVGWGLLCPAPPPSRPDPCQLGEGHPEVGRGSPLSVGCHLCRQAASDSGSPRGVPQSPESASPISAVSQGPGQGQVCVWGELQGPCFDQPWGPLAGLQGQKVRAGVCECLERGEWAR